MYLIEILLNAATIRQVNSTAIAFFCLKLSGERDTRLRAVTAETTKQTLTTSKYTIEFTFGDFPFHLKVNRDKLALVNRAPALSCNKKLNQKQCRG